MLLHLCSKNSADQRYTCTRQRLLFTPTRHRMYWPAGGYLQNKTEYILHIGHYQASRTYFDKNNSVHSKFHCADIFLLESQILHSHPYTRTDRLYCNTLYCDALLHSSDIWLLYHWMVKALDKLPLWWERNKTQVKIYPTWTQEECTRQQPIDLRFLTNFW